MTEALMLSTNLFFVSRIQYAARAAGVEMSTVKSIEKAKLDDSIRMVIVDLATATGTPAEIADFARASLPSARLVAFGAHVQTGRLEAAKDAGFDAVLTQGQLDRSLTTLFA